MAGVPYVFASATTSIPLSQLDADFNTPVTIGNTSVGLGNTVTSFGNVTLTNTTISGLSGGTANGVVYINSSNVAVANPSVFALDFNGNLLVGTTSRINSGAFSFLTNAGGTYTNNGMSIQDSSNGSGFQYLSFNGSSGTQIGNIIRSGTNNAIQIGASSYLAFAPNFTESARFNTSGNLQFTASNAGIVFNNSSALTNSTLNDYETGTWTPTFSGATIVGSVLYQGIYTKIGNIVTANFQVYSSSGGTIATVAGTTQITNFPFAFVGSSTVPFTCGTCVNTSTSTSGGFLQGGPANKIYFCTSLGATNVLSGTITYQTTF